MVEVAKARVLATLRARIESQRQAILESQRSSQAGATHSEARPEHAKDTRSTEASYLARGLARRVAELEEALGTLAAFENARARPSESVRLGSLVTLEGEDGAPSRYFLTPVGGGERLDVDGVLVQTLTPQAPLGRALMGREVDDDVAVSAADVARHAIVVSID